MLILGEYWVNGDGSANSYPGFAWSSTLGNFEVADITNSKEVCVADPSNDPGLPTYRFGRRCHSPTLMLKVCYVVLCSTNSAIAALRLFFMGKFRTLSVVHKQLLPALFCKRVFT